MIISRWIVRRFCPHISALRYMTSSAEGQQPKNLPISKQLQLVHALIKTGYDLKGDMDWKAIISNAKSGLKENTRVPVNSKEQQEMVEFSQDYGNGYIKELDKFLRWMVSTNHTDEIIIKAAKAALIEEAKNGYFPEMCGIFRHLAILSPSKDLELFSKLEPIFAENLQQLGPQELTSLLKALKEWNHISEPIYSKLIRIVFDTPHFLDLKCTIYFAYILQEQSVSNQKFYRHIQSYTLEWLEKIQNLSTEEMAFLLPASYAGMLMICLAKQKLLTYKQGKLIETIITKYIPITNSAKPLCTIFVGHSIWAREMLLSTDNLKPLSKRKSFRKHSSDFYHCILKRIIELKAQLKVEEIMDLMANATIGLIDKKQNGELMLKLAEQGFKKIKSKRSDQGNQEKEDQISILETDLYMNAKKYAKNEVKKKELQRIIQESGLKEANVVYDKVAKAVGNNTI